MLDSRFGHMVSDWLIFLGYYQSQNTCVQNCSQIYEIPEINNFCTNGYHVVKLKELPKGPWRRQDNGSWTGGIGVLQRREADVCSVGVGISLRQDSLPLQLQFLAQCQI